MDALFLWVMGGLLFVSVVILFLPVAAAAEVEPTATELGYLRRGTRGAVLTALGGLLTEGVIMVRSRGGVRRTDKPLRRCRDPFQRAVYDALHGPAGARDLATRPAVRRARADLAERLADGGLVPGRLRRTVGVATLIAVPAVAIAGARSALDAAVTGAALLITVSLWLLSRRTIAGHRLLRRMRRQRARQLAGLPPGGASRPYAAARAGGAAAGGVIRTGDCVDERGLNLALGFEAADFDRAGFDGGFDAGGGGDGGGGHH